jgi:hypothetical protein
MTTARRFLAVVVGLLLACTFPAAIAQSQPIAPPTHPSQPAVSDGCTLRAMTYNIEDVSTAELLDPTNPKLLGVAALIQRTKPDILLINEIAYDTADAVDGVGSAGLNGLRFARTFLAAPAREGFEGLHYRVFMAPSNTGVHSGLDLDNNDQIDASDTGRIRGGDSLGYGTYEGQYAMALLVRDGLTIDADNVRTFRTFLWKDMPGALLPPAVDERGNVDEFNSWYSDEELAILPLSSKSHWDVPVTLPTGETIHVLASHPTPPVFDGPEDRNGRRNHDEIRFWRDYINDEDWIVDDKGRTGGLPTDARFLIMGDLNADPDEGDTIDAAIRTLLLSHPRVQASPVPKSRTPMSSRRGDLDPDDTATFGLRVDYVLPSTNLQVHKAGVIRSERGLPEPLEKPGHTDEAPASVIENIDELADHFPVWVDLRVPARSR